METTSRKGRKKKETKTREDIINPITTTMVKEMSKDTILKRNQIVVSHAVLVAAWLVLAVALLAWFAVWLAVAAVWSAAE